MVIYELKERRIVEASQKDFFSNGSPKRNSSIVKTGFLRTFVEHKKKKIFNRNNI